MPVKRSKKLAIAEWLAFTAGHAEWRASVVRDFDMTPEVELPKLDSIERE